MSFQTKGPERRCRAATLLCLAAMLPACRDNENRSSSAGDGGGDSRIDALASNRDIASFDGYETSTVPLDVLPDRPADLWDREVDARTTTGPDGPGPGPDLVADSADDQTGSTVDATAEVDGGRDLPVTDVPMNDTTPDLGPDAAPGQGMDAEPTARFAPSSCTSAFQIVYSAAADEAPPLENDLAWKGGKLFVGRSGYENYSWVLSMPDQGGPKNLLYEGHVTGWWLEDDSLLYAQATEMFSMPLAGGPPLSSLNYGGRYNSSPSDLNLDRTAMYWVEYASQLRLYRHWRTGGDDTVLADIPTGEVGSWFYRWMGQIRGHLVLHLWGDTSGPHVFSIAKSDGTRTPLPAPDGTSKLLGLSQAGTLLWNTPKRLFPQPNDVIPGLARSELSGGTPVPFATSLPDSATPLDAWSAGNGAWYVAAAEQDDQQAVYLSIWYSDALGQAKRLACDPRSRVLTRPESGAEPQGTIAAAVAADGAFYAAVNYASESYTAGDWRVVRIENPGGTSDPMDTTGIVPDGGTSSGDAGTSCPSTTTSVGPYTVTEFPVPTAKGGPSQIALGPDDNVWFTEQETDLLGKVGPKGCIEEYSLPSSYVGISDLLAGPDGFLWFTSVSDDLIGHIAVDGLLYRVHDTPGSVPYPQKIALGPDGNFWFTSSTLATVGRITPSGKYDAFTLPCKACQTSEVASGTNGLVWFTEGTTIKLASIDSATGVAQEYSISGVSSFGRMTTGPDHNPWVVSSRSGSIYLTRINPDRTFTDFPLPAGAAYPYALAAGPDGNLWMTNSDGNALARFSISTGEFSSFAFTGAKRGLREITAARDGNIWFTEYSTNQIGRLDL